MIPKLVVHPEIQAREEYAQKFMASLGIDLNHPDLMWFDAEEKLGMEQAKKIKNFLKLKPYQAKGQIIILISAENLTPDAQNALLKTLEEHAEEVNFLLGAQSEDQLLPTLVSRCQVINLQQHSTPDLTSRQARMEQKYQKDIENLLNYTTEQRFQFIEKLKEKEEFLPALIIYFRHKLLDKSWGANINPPLGWISYLKELIEAERWAKQNVNIRAILEYLMLKMPKN